MSEVIDNMEIYDSQLNRALVVPIEVMPQSMVNYYSHGGIFSSRGKQRLRMRLIHTMDNLYCRLPIDNETIWSHLDVLGDPELVELDYMIPTYGRPEKWSEEFRGYYLLPEKIVECRDENPLEWPIKWYKWREPVKVDDI